MVNSINKKVDRTHKGTGRTKKTGKFTGQFKKQKNFNKKIMM